MEIPITFTLIIDDEDYDFVKPYIDTARLQIRFWYEGSVTSLHRALLIRHGVTIPDGWTIDHCDGRHLNNRKENLRAVPAWVNQSNRGANRTSSSKYVGVSYEARRGRWRARVTRMGKTVHLGYFDTDVEAATAVDRWKVENDPFRSRMNVEVA